MLSIYVNANHTVWDTFVSFITFAYNPSIQRTTGRTPFLLVHGREARIPLEVAWGSRERNSSEENDSAFDSLNRAREFVREKMQIEKQNQKDDYDQPHKPAEQFTIGEWVLVYKPVRKIGKSEKLLHRWHGPYQILSHPSPLNFEVRKLKDQKLFM